MLIRQPQVEIFDKIVRTHSGQFVRAYFALITIEGQSEVRFLGMRPLEASAPDFAPSEAPLALVSGSCGTTCADIPVRTFTSVFSPFSNLDLLVSQLARAPSAI